MQAFAGAFHPRRDDARGDDGGFEQAQVVAGVVEDLGEVGDFGDGAEVDAHQPQQRFVDDADVGFDGRARFGIAAMHRQIDGDVEDARAFREVHPQEEDVAPAAVREVHADGRGFVEDGEQPFGGALQQLAAHAQRVIHRMAGAEHPLVAAHGTHAAAHLIGQGLEAQAVVGFGERAGDGVGGAVGRLQGQEAVDGFFEAALEEVRVAVVGDQPPLNPPRCGGDSEPEGGGDGNDG